MEYEITNTSDIFQTVAEYLYKYNEKSLQRLVYMDTFNKPKYSWRHIIDDDENKYIHKIIIPQDIENFIFDYKINGEPYNIIFTIQTEKCNDGKMKILESKDHQSFEKIYKTLKIKAEEKTTLDAFIDEAKEYHKNIIELLRKKNEGSVRIFYYKEYWQLLTKNPKRSLDTIYLPENTKETIIKKIEVFLDEKTRDEYLYYGIPYKFTNMLYGVPGGGKTSLINAIASNFSCDIYVIPLTKKLDDISLIDAFSGINEGEERSNLKKLVVIEDIDCIFEDRKIGDDHNMVTLQGLLNCLDGFTTVEGTILFITANKPEVLDYALIRSCRIDNKLEIGYADKYQTQSMFKKFFPNNKNFDKFYNKISHREYTTAMLQELFFYNRKTDDIMKHIDEFIDIIEKNKPENLKSDKETNMYN